MWVAAQAFNRFYSAAQGVTEKAFVSSTFCCNFAEEDVPPALEVNLAASVTVQPLASVLRLPTQIPPVMAILINLFCTKGFEMSGSACQGTCGNPKALITKTPRKVFFGPQCLCYIARLQHFAAFELAQDSGHFSCDEPKLTQKSIYAVQLNEAENQWTCTNGAKNYC